MPYITRDQDNNIVGIYKRQQEQGQEYITDDNVEYVQFLADKEATETLLEEKDGLVRDLRQALKWQFKMILELFEVGKTNGVWVNTDFDADIRAKAADWKTKIARLDEIDAG